MKLKLFDKLKTVFIASVLCLVSNPLLAKDTRKPNQAPPPFVSNKNYLVMNLNLEDYFSLIEVVEKNQNLKLKSRGESHITVITPPEFEVLSKKITIKDINKLALDQDIQKTPIEPICIGEGKKQDLKTFYVVVKAPHLLEIRKKISDLFIEKGGSAKSFSTENYFPHVTIGFTERDLFESDGVIKDDASCIMPLP